MDISDSVLLSLFMSNSGFRNTVHSLADILA